MIKCYAHCVEPYTGICISCMATIQQPEKRTWSEWFFGTPKIYKVVYTQEALDLMPEFEDLSPETQERIRYINSLKG